MMGPRLAAMADLFEGFTPAEQQAFSAALSRRGEAMQARRAPAEAHRSRAPAPNPPAEHPAWLDNTPLGNPLPPAPSPPPPALTRFLPSVVRIALTCKMRLPSSHGRDKGTTAARC